jgi:N-acetyl-anhydromuramyl-L-alanine amidase AmpD
VVKVFGPASSDHRRGKYLGEAAQVFVVSGLMLTPADGATVEPSLVVEAEPIAVTSIASVKFFVDAHPVSTARMGPWTAKLTLTPTPDGRDDRTVSAFAYDARGVLLARASSKLAVKATPTSAHHLEGVAEASNHDANIQGKPAITRFPANPQNYARGRARPISMIVMHKTEGPSVESAVNWFHNAAAHATAHYVLDDTQIVQTVGDDNVAWHCGNSAVNAVSIGIEIAGFTDEPVKNDQVYRNAAKLVAWLCHKYGITPSSKTIIGHADVPDPGHPGRFGGANNHKDPGGRPNNPEHWDWDKFLGFVRAAYHQN